MGTTEKTIESTGEGGAVSMSPSTDLLDRLNADYDALPTPVSRMGGFIYQEGYYHGLDQGRRAGFSKAIEIVKEYLSNTEISGSSAESPLLGKDGTND